MPGLTLTRFDGEAFVIDSPDGPITVRVMSIRGNRVSLNILAPDDYMIIREELRYGPDTPPRPGTIPGPDGRPAG